MKYTCDVCGEVYTNVPVANDPKTVDEDSENETAETNEAFVNDPGTLGFTDADGFIINTPADPDGKITNFYKDAKFDADALAVALASLNNHQGVHSIQVASEYADRNGYVASTCVSTAIIPVVCENCGASLAYTWADFVLADGATDEIHPTLGFALNRDNPAIEGVDSSYTFGDKVDDADKKLNYLNHAGKAFGCGTHCDAYDAVNKVYICSGFDNEGTAHDSTVKLNATDFAAVDHSTVTVDYELANDSNYYETYSLKVATFYNVKANAAIVWSQAVMTDSTKLSKCANDGDMPAYVMPSVPTWDSNDKRYEYAADADSVYYLVLVSEDGKNIYPVAEDYAKTAPTDQSPLTAPALFTETNNKNIVTDKTTVEKDDTFFLSLNGAQKLKAPVYATNLSSLAKAISVAEVDKGVLTITLAEGVTFETIGRLTEIDSTILEAISDALSGKTGVESIVLDLNGSTIPVAADPTMTSAVAVTVKNGAINYVTASNENTDNYFITLNDGTSVTFDNVDINAGALNGISVAPSAKLVMKDSSVTSYGTMGISVDKSDATAVEAGKMATAITLTDTDIVMAKAPTAPVADQAPASTAMLVGAPVNVSVKGGEFSATMQALVVRGGNVTVSTTKLTVNAYTDTRVVYEDVDSKPTIDKENDDILWSALGGDTTATTGALIGTDWEGFVDGITDVQTYRLAGVWGTGAAVARAAVVLGNSSTTAYNFEATLRLDRVSWSVAEGAEKVVVGTSYAQSVLTDNEKTEGTGDEEKTTYTPVVTLNATGSNLNVADVVYTYISYNDEGKLANANYISMIGLIPAAD